MAFGELRRSARTGYWGKNNPKTSMGYLDKFRFQEMRGIPLPIRRVRLEARYTALSGGTFRATASAVRSRSASTWGTAVKSRQEMFRDCGQTRGVLLASALPCCCLQSTVSVSRRVRTTTRSSRACCGISEEPPLVAIAPKGWSSAQDRSGTDSNH
jgi:hypothetical protein